MLLQAMVYSKALRLSSLVLSNGQITPGQIINHMSVDATFLMYFFYFVHYIWAVPVQVGPFEENVNLNKGGSFLCL